MREDLSLLIELQECDTRLVSLLASKKNLPEKMAKLEQDFLAFRENIEQNKRKYEEIKSAHAAKEKEIKKINEGIVKAKERLLEVKNNKEYQAILKEIETAEASLGDIETQIISLLEEMDKLAVLVKKDEEVLNQHKRKYDEEKNKIQADIASIDTDFTGWEQKRSVLTNKVDGVLLAKYEKLKKRGNGIGVISVWKAVCNGCHMNIPPQLYNELQRSSELLSCPNCNRIIYFENKENSSH